MSGRSRATAERYADAGSRRGVAIKGKHSEPLTRKEALRWAKLEKDHDRLAERERVHRARMVRGLGLCVFCWGWVDDPRHSSIGSSVDLPASRVPSP